jgi:RNA polymerase sigma factor (sigma-70 family)
VWIGALDGVSLFIAGVSLSESPAGGEYTHEMTVASNPISDIELLNQHRNGSESAFADLVRRHLDWVYGVARRRVRDAHLADDVAQAVFIVLHRKAPQFAADGAMMRWLYRTAQYASETAARSERRRIAREANYAADHPEVVPGYESPEWKELAPILDRLIGKLPRADREAILLRYYRDLSPTEIAAQMGSTSEAVRKRIERAIEKLRGMAARDGIAMSSSALVAGLGQFIRLTPPPGLVATSTVAATAPASSAIAASSASIVKGTIIMTTGTKLAVGAAAVAGILVGGGVILGGAWILSDSSGSNQVPIAATVAPPPKAPVNLPTVTIAGPQVGPVLTLQIPVLTAFSSVPQLAPFRGLRWHQNVAEVEVNKTWYELKAIDGLTVEQIRTSQKNKNNPDWKKHFGEDLVDVMQQLGHYPGTTVNLDVVSLDAARLARQLSNVPLTQANRDALMVWPAQNQQYLFADLRWTNGTPEVLIGDTWYELLSVEKETTGRLIASSRAAAGDAWQQHFQQQILDDLRAANKGVPATADVFVKTLDSNEDVTITVRASRPRNLYTLNSVPKAAPFSAIRWTGNVPEVLVDNTWYELEAVDGLSIAQIHASQIQHGDWDWKKHFGEDLVEVLSNMNHAPGPTVDLKVRTLDGSNTQKTLTAVPMTQENRDALKNTPQPHR